MWKAGVSFVIIVEFALNALGINKSTETIKAITQVRNLLNKVNGDLNNLEKLLQELQGQGLGNLWVQTKDGTWVQTDIQYKGNKVTDYTPDELQEIKEKYGAVAFPTSDKDQMTMSITAWLQKNNDCAKQNLYSAIYWFYTTSSQFCPQNLE